MRLNDIIVNLILKFKYWFTISFIPKKIKNKSSIDKNRTLLFEDDFNETSWSTKHNSEKWNVRSGWGMYHPDEPHCYYAPPFDIKNSYVNLGVRYNPKTFNDVKKVGEKITIPYEVSRMIINDKYITQYGRFECRCKMPNTYAAWPAFWLTGAMSWPPEIDIFENYGQKTGKPINIQKINLHYGVIKDGTKTDMMPWGIKVSPYKYFIHEFHEYALEWDKNKMEIFVDGIKVFQYTRKDILDKWYNQENGKMHTIINNSIDKNFKKDIDDVDYQSEFLIDYVRIYSNKI